MPISVVERSRLRRRWAGARAQLGLSGSTESRPASALPGEAAASAKAQFTVKKVKLSSIVDPTAEADIIPLDQTSVRKMFEDYAALRGGLRRVRGSGPLRICKACASRGRAERVFPPPAQPLGE